MSRSRQRNARGSTLIEVLGAMTWGSILIVVLAAGAITMSHVSGDTNHVARVNTTLNAFSELLRSDEIAYQACPADVDEYGSQLAAAGGALKANAAIDVSVTAVDTGTGCSASDPADPGVQTITLTATWADVVQTADVVKSDPDPQRLIAVIGVTPLSGDGDAQKEFHLDGLGSRGPFDIEAYEWSCGDGRPSFTVTDPDDATARCSYPAPNPGDPDDRYLVELTVTSNGRQAKAAREVLVKPSVAPRPRPPVDFSYSPSNPGAGALVTFTSTGAAPLEGQVVKWEWSFDDPGSGSSNSFVCTDPTCSGTTHRFNQGGNYNVTLRVTDNFNLTNSTTKSVNVTPPTLPPPTASFVATPSAGISPQTVLFDASASTNAGGGSAGLTYSWTLNGGAATRTGVNPSFNYPASAGTIADTVTLRVTATNGAFSEISHVVTLLPFSKPTNFQFVRANVPLLGDKSFIFSWTEIARSPGDQISYKVRVVNTSGCLTFGNREATFASTKDAGQTLQGTLSIPGSICSSVFGLNPLTFQAWVSARRIDGANNETWTPESAPITFVVR